MKLYATLTPKKKSRSMNIQTLVDRIEDYKKDLNNKTAILVNRLLEIGIDVAECNVGEYGQYIVFERRVNEAFNGYIGVLIGKDGQKYFSEWDLPNGEKAGYEVSPILLAEFGSGWFANVIGNITGVGQGTMPNAKGHAFDPKGWWYRKDGEWHHSYGERPTYPMHRATVQMLVDIDRIAKEVFNG